jgi:hypothetical protein
LTKVSSRVYLFYSDAGKNKKSKNKAGRIAQIFCMS